MKITVFGAGNSSPNHCGSTDTKVYPASYDACVSVTSVGHIYDVGHPGRTDWKDVHLMHMDSTKTFHHNDAVNICAPGYYVTCAISGGGYQGIWGTSLSAPIVAGVVAMIMAVNPNLTANEVVDILLSTADPSLYSIPENAPFIGKLGTGRVDAYAAVQKALCTITTVDFKNQIVVADTTVKSCGNINIQNVKVQNNAKLTLEAAGEVIFNGDFEVELGSELEIKY